MKQVHIPTEDRKTQGQHQHKFPYTLNKFTHLLGQKNTRTAHQHKFPQMWNKFTHILRAGKHKDSISASSMDMEQVHTPTEGKKTQGPYQHMFPQTWNRFTHQLREGKHKDISTRFHRHGTSSTDLLRKEKARTALAQVSTDMEKVHIPSDGKKIQGQASAEGFTDMEQVHTHPEGRKAKGQH